MNIFEPFSTQHVAVLDGGRPHRRRVAARAGLGQAPRGQLLALRERHQVLLLLLFGAEHRDVRGTEPVVRGHRQRHARIDARELFDADAVVDGAHAGAAVGLGELDAHQAEVGQLRQQFLGKVLRFVPLHDVGPNFGFGEFANALAKERLLVGQREIHCDNYICRRTDVVDGSRRSCRASRLHPDRSVSNRRRPGSSRSCR